MNLAPLLYAGKRPTKEDTNTVNNKMDPNTNTHSPFRGPPSPRAFRLSKPPSQCLSSAAPTPSFIDLNGYTHKTSEHPAPCSRSAVHLRVPTTVAEGHAAPLPWP